MFFFLLFPIFPGSPAVEERDARGGVTSSGMLSHLHRQAGRGDALSCGLGTGLQENNCLHLLRAANSPLRLRQRSAKPPGFVTRARGSEAGIARRRGAEHKGWGIGAAPGPEAFHRPVNSPSQGMKKAFHPPEESSCKFLGNENAFFLEQEII